MRGATATWVFKIVDLIISIHAPHAGRAMWGRCNARPLKTFNPRAPCGARRAELVDGYSVGVFQSTRPMRGATFTSGRTLLCKEFQSTRPMRGATNGGKDFAAVLEISIHAPHAGRDSKSIQNYFTHFCDKRQFLDNFTQNAAF